jgi:hypothetical protein
VDAEKFDKVVLDLLYDELDELTRASALRHMEQSSKAKALYAELRATKEVGTLPLVDVPDDLEAKILAAEEAVRAGRPLHQRIGGVVSRIASYTMRPQVGMAAVLMLMVGSSLLFLRVKPGEPSSVQVTERGVPESDKEGVALVPVPEAPAPARIQDGTLARSGGGNGRSRAADTRDLSEEASKKGAVAKSAPMPAERREYPEPSPVTPPQAFPGAASDGDEYGGVGAAQASRGAGAGPYDDAKDKEDAPVVGPCGSIEQELARSSSPIETNRARWALAECYASLGRNEQARSAYKALLGVPAYTERARRALATLAEPNANASTPVAAAKPASPKPAASPKAEATASSAPQK